MGVRTDAQRFGRICVLGGGNLGQALARGLVERGGMDPEDITVTRRDCSKLQDLASIGILVTEDNISALDDSEIVIIAVQPQQVPGLFMEIREVAESRSHTFISVVSGISTETVREGLGLTSNPVVRAMPNTAVAVGEAVTCLASMDSKALNEAEVLFKSIGKTLRFECVWYSFFPTLYTCCFTGGHRDWFSSRGGFILGSTDSKGGSFPYIGSRSPSRGRDRSGDYA